MSEKKSKQPAKAYSYIRFSTPEQMAGDSMRRQTTLAKQYAQTHGLALDDQLTYQDLGLSGYSGANAKRGKLAEFLDAVEKGVVARGSYLLVESLDRLSRQNPYDALQVLMRIIDGGVTVVSLMGDPRVYSSETVRKNQFALMEFLLIAGRAHEESATKQRRATEAWRAALVKAKAGESRGASACPSWMRATADGKAWELIPDRVAVVRRIFELAKRGVGKDSIAKQLNAEQVPTFNESKQWWGSYIVRILSNRGVIGEHTPKEKLIDTDTCKATRQPLKPIKGYYPPAITKKLWDEVAALQRTNPRRGRHAKAPVANLFGGLAKCPACGGAMTRVSKGNTSRAWPYLVCASAKMGAKDESGKPVCAYRSVGYSRVESAFLDAVSHVRDEAPKPTARAKAIEKERRNLMSALSAADDQLENLLRVAEKSGGVRPAALVGRIQELEKARADAQAQLRKLDDDASHLDRTMVAARLDELEKSAKVLAKAIAHDAKEGTQTAPQHRTEVNAVLRRLLEGVVIDYRAGVLRFQWRHSDEESSLVFAFPEER